MGMNGGGMGGGADSNGRDGMGNEGHGGNRGEGAGANWEEENRGIASLRAPDQYLPNADPVIETLQMGGTPNNYPPQTTQPNYNDLKAKYTAGYTNPATKDRSTPNLFNFNGTVYKYEPEDDSFQDTYAGTKITPTNDQRGSLGIEDLYGAYVPNAYQQQPNTLQPVASPDTTQIVNPEYTQWLADQANTAGVKSIKPWTSAGVTDGSDLSYGGRNKDNVPDYVGVKDWIYNQGGGQVLADGTVKPTVVPTKDNVPEWYGTHDWIYGGGK